MGTQQPIGNSIGTHIPHGLLPTHPYLAGTHGLFLGLPPAPSELGKQDTNVKVASSAQQVQLQPIQPQDGHLFRGLLY